LSAPGRSEALALERAARKESHMSAPGRSEALRPQPSGRRVVQ